MSFISNVRPVLIAAAVLAAPSAFAQSTSPGYFMPPSHTQAPAAAPAPAPAPVMPQAPAPAAPQAQAPAQQAAMPPIPQLPDLPKEAAPPVAVIGVLSVPEVMQKSTAAQGVQAIIQQRQAELGHDAQQARAKIQAEQARILAERGKLSDSELEAASRRCAMRSPPPRRSSRSATRRSRIPARPHSARSNPN